MTFPPVEQYIIEPTVKQTKRKKKMIRRSALQLCVTVSGGAASPLGSAAAATATTTSRSRGREELAKMRATVSVNKPTTAESMVTFKDTRPLPEGETDVTRRRRLVYQSRYRGMVEMDIIFGSFANAKLEKLAGKALEEYDTLLRQFDNDLFNWLVSGNAPPAEIGSMGAWKELKTFVDDNNAELLGHRL
jgi:succinate dehydrogenase assembly factor 2